MMPMSARNPKELDVLFETALNAGDLDGLLALYEPHAAFTSQPGQVVTGTAAIREAIAGFLSLKPSMALETKVLAETGGIALLTSRWRLTGTGPDGAAVELTGTSAEVVRRQPDGSWLFVVDTPYGLEW
jgi:uncharacterized protein (TIGR02246 family)